MSKRMMKTGVLAIAAAAIFGGTQAQALTLGFDLDGNGDAIARGQIIDSEYASVGVNIVADNPNKDFDWAIAFDAATPTGGDTDLFQPQQGNVLIISERNVLNGAGNVRTPDDEALGGSITFNYDVRYNTFSFVLLDNDDAIGDALELYLGGSLMSSMALPTTVDGGITTVAVTGIRFDTAKIVFGGSGAIDDVTSSVIPVPVTAGLGLMGLMAAGSAALRRRRA